MLAYVKLVQQREKDLGVDVLTHQKWSGASYMDGILGAVQSGSSSSRSLGSGNTETGKGDNRHPIFFPLTAIPRILTRAFEGITSLALNLKNLTFDLRV